MSRIGFVGLGTMGAPMARNLLRAGHDLVVHSRSAGSVEALVAEGATSAAGAAEVAGSVEALLLCLPDTPDVEEVVLGEGGVLEGASPGLLLIDCSTITPQAARTVAERAAAAGVLAVDAPVSGGEQGAIDGTLSIMVGGDESAFAGARPILEAVGATIVHVGGAGAGQTVKAANQLLVGGIIGLVAEALLLLESADVDVSAAVEALSGGLAGNRILERKAAAMLERTFPAGFRLALHHKDMGIVLATGRDLEVPLPLGGLVAQLVAAGVAAGDGALDHSALLRALERLAGAAPVEP